MQRGGGQDKRGKYKFKGLDKHRLGRKYRKGYRSTGRIRDLNRERGDEHREGETSRERGSREQRRLRRAQGGGTSTYSGETSTYRGEERGKE